MTNPLKNVPEPQEDTMSLSLTQAAKAAKISKSTLSVAIQKGRLSALHLSDGSYQIEPVELFRVFPPKADTTPSKSGSEPVPNTSEPMKVNQGSPPIAPEVAELAVLKAKVEAFDRERELRDRERDTLQSQVVDLQKRLDRAEERILALAAPERPQEAPVVTSPIIQPARGFWGRLLGR